MKEMYEEIGDIDGTTGTINFCTNSNETNKFTKGAMCLKTNNCGMCLKTNNCGMKTNNCGMKTKKCHMVMVTIFGLVMLGVTSDTHTTMTSRRTMLRLPTTTNTQLNDEKMMSHMMRYGKLSAMSHAKLSKLTRLIGGENIHENIDSNPDEDVPMYNHGLGTHHPHITYPSRCPYV